MADQKDLPSILPLIPKISPTSTQDRLKRGHSGPAETQYSIVKKRRGVAVACNRCRTRKTSCDAQRPACGRCLSQNVPCEYISKDETETTLMVRKREMADLREDLVLRNEILESLRAASEPDAITILRLLRDAKDVSTAHTVIQARNLSSLRLSDIETARANLPETHTAVEFELAAAHSKVYTMTGAIDLDAIDLVNTETFELQPSSMTKSWPQHAGDHPQVEDFEDMDTIDPSVIHITATLDSRPPQFRTVKSSLNQGVDQRLVQLKIGFWTKMPIEDEFAAAVISHYLETDHRIIAFFDADLFLSDLIEHRLEHCSAFLVSSVLCLACLGYTGLDSRATALSVAFWRDTVRFWHAEQLSKQLTTIAAFNVMAMAASQIGQDQIAAEAAVQARTLCGLMHLFSNMPADSSSAQKRETNTTAGRAEAHVAWGTFSWLTLRALFFHETSLPFPPSIPIPEYSAEAKSELQKPTSRSSDAVELGDVNHPFPLLCRFWSIVRELMMIYLDSKDKPVPQRVPLAFVEAKHQQLLQWASNLGTHMISNADRSFHTLIILAFYHFVVADMFRPFVQDANYKSVRLLSFASRDATPQALYDLSIRHLQHLILEFSLHHEPKHYSHFFNAATVVTCNTVLQDIDNPDWQSWFLLCARYWKEIAVKSPVMVQIARASLSFAMNMGRITGTEARLLMEQIQGDLPTQGDEVATAAIFDFSQAMSTETGYRANELANKYDELTLFDDLISR